VNSSFADVDLILAAWCLIAVWFLVRYRRAGQASNLVCSALAMGAVLGTKYIAIPFLFWLVVASAVLIWRNGSPWRHMAILVAGVLLPSAYWYGRNLLLTGNPLYPLHVQVLGNTILSGWYTRETMLTSHYHIPVFPLGRGLRVLVQLLIRVFDPILLPFWLSGLVAAVVAAMRRWWLAAALVGLAGLHVLCFWFVNPYQTQERFLLTAIGLFAVPVALVLDRWKFLCLPLVGLCAWHLVVDQFNLGISKFPGPMPAPFPLPKHWGQALQEQPVLLGRIACLVAFGVAVTLLALSRGEWRRRLVVGGVAILVGVAGVGFRAHKGQPMIEGARWRFYPVWLGGYLHGWNRLEDASGDGARVAYTGTNLPFYLFGVGLRNRVMYVNVNKHAAFRMHDYHTLQVALGEPLSSSPAPDWDRRETDEQSWIKNLRDRRIELLFVGKRIEPEKPPSCYDSEGFLIERTWADRNPEFFRLIHADPFTRVYAVRFQLN
jgi:hypothetical protein